ncbi:MAG TPA: tetratricopeptide repeat protein [Chthoniobacteraceae bacterium]|nr:tetratricopeptide repeat protein [Chthoniobacteraceae bacterium]
MRRPETAVFVTAIILRLWVLSRFIATPYSGLQMGDMKFYHEWAVRILHGQWTDGHAFYGLPGYAYLLAGIYRVLGTDFAANWMVIGVLQSVCEAFTAVLIFKFARVLCTSETGTPGSMSPPAPPRSATIAAALAALAYVLFIPAQTFSIILMPTAWLVCAYWWCVWQGVRPANPRALWRWLGFGMLVGVVAMMIATILFAIPMLLTAIALQAARATGFVVPPSGGETQNSASGADATRSLPADVSPPKGGTTNPWRRALLGAALLLAGVGVGTSPAWIHNYFVAQDPVLLSAHGGLNFWMGNNPVANGYPKIPSGLRPGQEGLLKDSITRAEEAAGHPLKRTEVSRYWSEQANAYIREHPGDEVRLLGTKIRNFWNAFQYDDISVITLFKERGVTLPGPRFGFVAALGLAGLLIGVWRNVPARWVAAAVVLHMGALLSVFITERYRLAAAPGLIILGAYVIWRLCGAVCGRRWPVAAGLALLITATTFLTRASTRDPALWSLDPYNLGVKELEVAEGILARRRSLEEIATAGRELDSAEGHLKKAFALMPGNPGILFALGNLSLDRGDRPGARQWYDRTLALSPEYAGALKNLGYLAVEEEQWAVANSWLERAARAEPDNATTYYLLAKAKLGLGDKASARALALEALRLKPDQREFGMLIDRIDK